MNKCTKLFEEFLDLIEFTLVKHKSSDEEYNPWIWSLIDTILSPSCWASSLLNHASFRCFL